MLSYVFMKILERRPRQYDQRMDRASKGHVTRVKHTVAEQIPDGARVLEIGCGTGELAAMLVQRGATVDAFDMNPAMVGATCERIARAGLQDRFTVRRMGIDSMDSIQAETYGAAVATLVFSELTEDERRFALDHAFRVLKPGALLVIADEALARTPVGRILQSLTRAPLLAVTYLVAQTYTRPLADLDSEVEAAGFSILKEHRSHKDTFQILVAKRPEREG